MDVEPSILQPLAGDQWMLNGTIGENRPRDTIRFFTLHMRRSILDLARAATAFEPSTIGRSATSDVAVRVIETPQGRMKAD